MGPSDRFLVASRKAQTTSQQSPGTASACEGLTEQGSCDRVPRNNGVEADRGFSRMPRGNDNRYNILYFDAQIGDFLKLRDNRGFWEFNYVGEARDY